MNVSPHIIRLFMALCIAGPLHAQVVTTVPMPMCSSRIDTLVQVRSFNGIAVDDVGYIYLSEWNSGYILKWAQGDSCMQVVESTAERKRTNGAAPEARVPCMHGLTVDHSGNLYVTEFNGGVIQKISPNGDMRTVAGCRWPCATGESGPATAIALDHPNMVIVDNSGNLYISDEMNHVVRKVPSDGNMITYAGMLGAKGHSSDGLPANGSLLNMPYGLALNAGGELYIADTRNNVVRKVGVSGNIVTVAGNGQKGYSGDNGPATSARLNKPMGMATDGKGNLYIADEENNVVRMVSTDGIISTYAGTGEKGSSPDGTPAKKCKLNNPRDVAIDRMGSLYIIDFNTDNLRRVHMIAAPAINDEDELVNVSVNDRDELVVKIERGIYFSVAIMNDKNEQQLSVPIRTNPQKIDIHALLPGNYSLVFRRSGHSKTVRFVKSE